MPSMPNIQYQYLFILHVVIFSTQHQATKQILSTYYFNSSANTAVLLTCTKATKHQCNVHIGHDKCHPG